MESQVMPMQRVIVKACHLLRLTSAPAEGNYREYLKVQERTTTGRVIENSTTRGYHSCQE